MRELTIRIQDEDSAMQAIQQRFVSTMKTGDYAGEFLSFESPAALFRAITPKRWELIAALQGLGRVSMRELARQTKRDVHRVYDDVKARRWILWSRMRRVFVFRLIGFIRILR